MLTGRFYHMGIYFYYGAVITERNAKSSVSLGEQVTGQKSMENLAID